HDALGLILKPMRLALMFQDSAARITSQQAARGPLVSRVYSVADLVVPMLPVVKMQIGLAREKASEADEWAENLHGNATGLMTNLVDVITAGVAPESWEEVGGPGSVKVFATTLSLVVRQSQDVHDEIADLLAQLRRLQNKQVSLSMTAFRVP